MTRTRVAAGAAALLIAGALTGCGLTIPADGFAPPSEPSEGSDAQSSTCDDAFATASDAMNAHYATHPYYGEEYDELYADGELTDEEQVTLDTVMADEEAKFTALIDPIYDACDGVEDMYAAAFDHREDADWGLVNAPALTSDDLKAMFIITYCFDMTDRPACNDFVAEDWD